jgi:hypothetical protein
MVQFDKNKWIPALVGIKEDSKTYYLFGKVPKKSTLREPEEQ